MCIRDSSCSSDDSASGSYRQVPILAAAAAGSGSFPYIAGISFSDWFFRMAGFSGLDCFAAPVHDHRRISNAFHSGTCGFLPSVVKKSANRNAPDRKVSIRLCLSFVTLKK